MRGLKKPLELALQKLDKYFPERLSNTNLPRFKAYFFTIILDPRFKLRHFDAHGKLRFYTNISRDIIRLLTIEFKRYI